MRRGALTALLLALGAGAAFAAVDPFYEARYSEGVEAVRRGEPASAVPLLRIACFGMLDEPSRLGDCLVRLALAQAAAGDEEGFLESAHRLLDADERVGAYSEAAIPEALRNEFEARVLGRLPPERLRASAAFAGVIEAWEEDQVRSLAPKARRRRLAALVAGAPRDARWHRLTAELEMQEDHPEAAERAAARAVELVPDDAAASCLLGWAEARLGRCASAIPRLDACAVQTGAPFALALLSCRVDAEAWDAARELLASMPPAWTAAGEGRSLAEAVRRHASP